MKKNRLGDLNDHLFEEIERLNDDDLKGNNLAEEITRAKAIANVATQIIANGRLALNAMSAVNDGLIKSPPAMLGISGWKDDETEG